MAKPTLREQVTDLQTSNEELLKANEHLISETTLLNRRVEEMGMIDLSNAVMGWAGETEVISQRMRVAALQRIRRLRVENPMAKQAIKLALRFVLGKGVSYDITEENTKRIVDEFWNDPVNQVVWTSHDAMVQNFDELLTDGEQFVGLFAEPGETPYVRIAIIPMEEITHILYDPDNGRVPVWYRRAYKRRVWDARMNNNEGGWKPDSDSKPTIRYYRDFRISDEHLDDIESRGLRIPKGLMGEGAIKHRRINTIKMKSGLRGLSELFASREWFRVIKEFVEDRGAINAQANSLTRQRKVTGGPAAIGAMTGRIGGLQMGVSGMDQPLSPSSFRRPLAGSMVDTNPNVEYKDIRADTGAPGAAKDLQSMVTIAGAGTATPEHYFGGTNNALAGAQSVEVAVIKAFEDFQTYLRNDFRETVEFVISVALDKPMVEVDASEKEMSWKFPPIMTQDLVKWITGLAQWAQQIAPKNRVVRQQAIKRAANVLGIENIDLIWDEVMDEEERVYEQEDAQAEMQMQSTQANMAANNGVGKPPGKLNANGKQPANGIKPPDEGQKVTTGPTEQGASPQISRLQKGRPPNEGATGPRSKRQ